MTGRILVATLACVLVAGLALWLEEPATALTRQAEALAGERWYALTLEDRHLGYLRTRNYRDGDGNWVFESEQRFAMNPYDTAATINRRTFAGTRRQPARSSRHNAAFTGASCSETRSSLSCRQPADPPLCS